MHNSCCMCLHCQISLPITEILPVQAARRFFPRAAGSCTFASTYPFPRCDKARNWNWVAVNSRLHWTPCCNLQFFKSIVQLHWKFLGINFTSSKESNQQWLIPRSRIVNVISVTEISRGRFNSSAVWSRTARSDTVPVSSVTVRNQKAFGLKIHIRNVYVKSPLYC